MNTEHNLQVLKLLQSYKFLKFTRHKSGYTPPIGPKRKFPINPTSMEILPVYTFKSKNTSQNRVYVWGRGETGALGLALNNSNKLWTIENPRRLSFAELNEVTDFACGYGFTAFAVKSKTEHKVYGTGINTDSQIGFHTKSRTNRPLAYIVIPQPLCLPLKNPETTEVRSISAGRAHMVVLTDEGLFTVGNNAYGQCGRKIIEDEMYLGNSIIHHVDSLDAKDLQSVQCGQDHSLVLTKGGKVYAAGWGADGQTGLGHYNNESKFSLVKGDIQGEHITKLSCTADCVLALNKSGEVFGWGNSEYGQLPLANDSQQIHTPIHVITCQGLGRIVDIATGGSFCMVLNENGDVFVWGYGLLGLGPKVQQSAKPTHIPPALFGKGDFDKNCHVTAISCGLSQLAAVNNNGDLFMWGRNRTGCLGLGHLKDQFFPFKVAVSASVKKVSCGVDHTVVLCKPFS